MIVRILGEGQWEVPQEALGRLNALDDEVEKAVVDDDADQLAAALASLHDEVRASGTLIASDDLRESDLILPGSDASLGEVATLLGESDEGLIPG